MSFLNDIFGKPLPTRTGGGIGASEENRMLGAVGGANTIRTKLQTNADGSTTMLRTRGGSPEFTTVKPAPKPVEPIVTFNRTFVFNLLTTPITKKATVANRGATPGSMVISAKKITVAAACYFISLIRTPAQTPPVNWSDVIRTDYEPLSRKVKINNGGVNSVFLTSSETMFPDLGSRFALPYLWTATSPQEYVSQLPDSWYQRSPLFLGVSTAQTRKVSSVGLNGSEQSSVSPSDGGSMQQMCSAGLRLTNQGKYGFYGGSCGIYHPTTGSLCPSLTSATSIFSECQTSGSFPFITETIHGIKGQSLFDQGVVRFTLSPITTYSSTTFASPSVEPIWYSVRTPTLTRIDGLTVRSEYAAEVASGPASLQSGDYRAGAGYATFLVSGTCDNSISNYAFSGTQLAMSLDATLDVNFNLEGAGTIVTTPQSGQNLETISFLRRHQSQLWQTVSGGNAYYNESSTCDKEVTSATITTKVALKISNLRDLSNVAVTVETAQKYHIETRWVEESYTAPAVAFDFIHGSSSQADAAMLQAPTPWILFVGNHGHSEQVALFNDLTELATCVAVTRDYIFADIDEDVFVYLEANVTARRRTVGLRIGYQGGSVTYDSGIGSFYQVSYILEVRGVRHEFVVVANTLLTEKTWFDLVNFYPTPANSDAPNYGSKSVSNAAVTCHKGYLPPPIFNPRFMSQGNCPFIAYTTKLEEAGGATPEIYLDMKVLIMRYEDLESGTFNETSEFDDGLEEGLVKYAPHQFIQVHNKFICGETVLHGALVTNKSVWATIFPAIPTRLQFYNGVKGAVSTKLGASFSGDPLIEISRI